MDMAEAFMARRPLSRSNTRTDGTGLWLFGNLIANHVDGGIIICSGGHRSVTTRDRLNALPGIYIRQLSYTWYLRAGADGGPYLWDGSPIFIANLPQFLTTGHRIT